MDALTEVISRYRQLVEAGVFFGIVLDPALTDRFEALAAECSKDSNTIIELVSKMKVQVRPDDDRVLRAYYLELRTTVKKLKVLPDNNAVQQFAVKIRHVPGASEAQL